MLTTYYLVLLEDFALEYLLVFLQGSVYEASVVSIKQMVMVFVLQLASASISEILVAVFDTSSTTFLAHDLLDFGTIVISNSRKQRLLWLLVFHVALVLCVKYVLDRNYVRYVLVLFHDLFVAVLVQLFVGVIHRFRLHNHHLLKLLRQLLHILILLLELLVVLHLGKQSLTFLLELLDDAHERALAHAPLAYAVSKHCCLECNKKLVLVLLHLLVVDHYFEIFV